MSLTLEIISSNGEPLGAARRKVFGPGGGRIGRAPDCDWVLANPYVSRHHATIRCTGGVYCIERVGDNRVAVGSPEAQIAQMQQRVLRGGDRIFIDEYEIAVSLNEGLGDSGSPSPGTSVVDFDSDEDPFAAPVVSRGPGVASGASVSSSALGSSSLLDGSLEDLDPLKRLGGAPGVAPAASARAVSWNHTPGVSDQFTPPAVAACAPAPTTASASSGALPDDWDQTTFGRVEVPPMGGDGARTSAPKRAPGLPSAQPASQTAHSPLQTGYSAAQPQANGALFAGDADMDMAAVLRAAGVDPANVGGDTAKALGLIFRAVVQGVMEVLRARAEIKDQFRLPMTRIQRAENNPLKFAADADDALNALFGRRSDAYLPPVDAFEDAFRDIRFHQMAVLAGIRAGFEHVVSRFDPKLLQEQFEKRSGKRGGLMALGGRSRFWELYVEEFERLTADQDQAFRNLFGDKFSTAYEKQLDALSSRGR